MPQKKEHTTDGKFAVTGFSLSGTGSKIGSRIRIQLRKLHIKVSLPAMLESEVFYYMGAVQRIRTQLRKLHIQVSLF